MSADQRYNLVAVALHWVMAILIIGQIAGGLYMHNLPNASPIKFDLFQLHKSFGLTILGLTFLRLVWRLSHRPPALPSEMPGWQKVIARGTHWLFYVLLIATPLVGWAVVSVSPRDIPTVWFGLIEIPHMPFFENVADREAVEGTFKERHEYLAFTILFLLALHIGAAMKHRFINRDGVFRSMAPGNTVQWVSILLMLAALVSAAGLYWIMPSAKLSAAQTSRTSISEGNWQVDYDNSRIAFIGEEKGRRFEGDFRDFTAEIYFDPSDLEASWVDVSVKTMSAVTGEELRDATMPGSEWFNVKQHPVARFQSETITQTASGFEAAGILTIKENEQAISLPFTVDINGDAARARAAIELSRIDFDLGVESSWLEEEKVAISVRIEIDILAQRQD